MRWRWAAAGIVVAGALIAAVVLPGGEEARSETAVATSTAKVTRGPLSAAVSVDGTLGYRALPDGSPFVAINRASGVYTQLPEAGDEVGCGDVLYRVDGHAVLLFCGATPAYRDLSIGDEGRDVRQLNRNLGVKDGGEFTWRTRDALRELPHHSGGRLDVEDAVVLPEAARIAEVRATLGSSARPGTQVLTATSDAPVVRVQLDALQQSEVRRGDRATITLPGNRTATGKVTRVGRVAVVADAQNGTVADATIPANIALDTPKVARDLDRAPVRAEVRTEGVKDALSVPVLALLGRSGGGFAVEVPRRGLVAVKLGLFDTTSGRVQILAGLREGDDVVVP